MGNLRIQDISVGDWVEYSGRPKQVGVIDLYKNNQDNPVVGILVHKSPDGRHRVHYHNIDKYNPIPLTAKILRINGFIESEDYKGRFYNKDMGCVVTIFTRTDKSFTNKYKKGKPMIVLERFKYVHQLQHALRLVGITKEIEMQQPSIKL